MLHWPQTKSEPNKREENPDWKNTPAEEGRRCWNLNWVRKCRLNKTEFLTGRPTGLLKRRCQIQPFDGAKGKRNPVQRI
jgi:hypothetical protein